MFVRLTRPMRAKAGWFVALLYLFCVLAPGVALALGDAASCHVQQFGTAAAAHVHEGAQPEHAAAHQHHAMQADQHAMHHADAGHAMPGHAKHQHDGKGSPGTVLRHALHFGDRGRSARGCKTLAADLALRRRESSAPAGRGAPSALSSSHRLIRLTMRAAALRQRAHARGPSTDQGFNQCLRSLGRGSPPLIRRVSAIPSSIRRYAAPSSR